MFHYIFRFVFCNIREFIIYCFFHAFLCTMASSVLFILFGFVSFVSSSLLFSFIVFIPRCGNSTLLLQNISRLVLFWYLMSRHFLRLLLLLAALIWSSLFALFITGCGSSEPEPFFPLYFFYLFSLPVFLRLYFSNISHHFTSFLFYASNISHSVYFSWWSNLIFNLFTNYFTSLISDSCI